MIPYQINGVSLCMKTTTQLHGMKEALTADASGDPAHGVTGLKKAGSRAWTSARNVAKLENLYALNLALLATHEIDSAYWHEWNLFGQPGGIQLFLVLYLALLTVFLIGLLRLVKGHAGAVWFSIALSAGGTLAFVLHSYFLLQGHGEFRLPVSLAVLALMLIVSLVQARLSLRLLSHSRPSRRMS